MSPEAELFLEKALLLLGEAQAMLTIHLYAAAGRTAYLAGYHAAQGLIFERTGKSARTHHGVHSELSRLTRDDPSFDPALRTFLSQSYNLKAIADYETGPAAEVPPERAVAAVAGAAHFVAFLNARLAGSG